MLVDIHGHPLQAPSSTEMQTDEARLTGLLSHYSDHPSRGLTPSKLGAVMVAAEQGNMISQCELAEDIEEKDGHIFAELQKRRRALLTLDSIVVPPRNPSKNELYDVAMLNELLEDMTELEDLILGLTDAILKGFSNYELEWDYSQRLHIPQFHWRDPAWFQTHPDNPNELRLQSSHYAGDALQPFGWISHTHAAKSGYIGRSGLVRVLAWPYLFKNYSVRDLAEFLEIYGLPLRLGKYSTGASEKEKATLLKAVMSIGHNAGGIIPRGMEIDFTEAAKGGSDPFEAMIDWCERTQSKAILGGTLTSQADGQSSTNALGNVHNEVRKELTESDAKQVANTLTRDLIYPLYALNGKSYAGPQRMPRLEFDVSDAEDLAYYSEHLTPLVSLGVPVPTNWVTDKLKIPKPENGEAVLTAPNPLASPLPASLAALKAKTAAPEPVDEMAGQLATDMAPVLETFTAEIQQLMEQADSLEELQTLLASADLSTDQASTVMQMAFAAAELAGQYDVSEGE